MMLSTSLFLTSAQSGNGRGRYKKLPTGKEAELKKEILLLQENRDGGRVIGKT